MVGVDEVLEGDDILRVGFGKGDGIAFGVVVDVRGWDVKNFVWSNVGEASAFDPRCENSEWVFCGDTGGNERRRELYRFREGYGCLFFRL